MVRKKIDNRIRVLIENGVILGHRTLFVIVGDKGRDQVVILHHMLSKAAVKARPSVLWCYKKELGFSSHRKKKMKHLQKKIKTGQLNVNEDDPFELFIAATNIRYCYYSETHKILGNTYGMCVLQDFEAMTPNLLARTVETVEGGGIIVVLLKSVTSLRQLYTLSMDVHERYRTESHQDVVCRFNERFLLSLATCSRCLVVDDQLRVLPLSSHVLSVEPLSKTEEKVDSDLEALKESLKDTQPVGVLVSCCRTLDQGKALLKFVEGISEKSLRTTVSLTAARGRGKSAALGLAVAAAVAFGYSNIFVTAPSPENLRTLFEFVFKGFDALEYQEHIDYDLLQSTNPDFNKAIVRVNIFHDHRQTIQYIHPSDANRLAQAELVVVDEAAAIPLPLVKSLFGPHLLFLASTIDGYEGTGRSLTAKLLKQLRNESVAPKLTKGAMTTPNAGRVLYEVELTESIRYRPGDAVETWLGNLLCLGAEYIPKGLAMSSSCPPPELCELYHVNRDTLFCHHAASEAFLHRLVELFVASHYRNSPDDLLMMSDAPAHRIFVLLGPTRNDSKAIPEVLAAVQICLEGGVSRDSVQSGLSRGRRAWGDLIPWTVAQQYQDVDFPSLCGARVVRIATHPDYQGMGYGSRALSLLRLYYSGGVPYLPPEMDKEDQVGPEDGIEVDEGIEKGSDEEEDDGASEDNVKLLTEKLAPRKSLPPLLQQLSERQAEELDYLGVSYGLTSQLLRFWKRASFVPVYLRQTPNDLTGEHTCIMINPLNAESEGGADDGSASREKGTWLREFWLDFRRRFISLLAFHFRRFETSVALGVLQNKVFSKTSMAGSVMSEELEVYLTRYDLKRLETYASNVADHHLITDLLPAVARLYFLNRLGDTHLSALQGAILLGMGLQCKTADDLGSELQLPSSQLLGLFNRTIRRLVSYFRTVVEQSVEKTIAIPAGNNIPAVDAGGAIGLQDELHEASQKIKSQQKSELLKLKREDLSNYAVGGSEEEWGHVLSSAKLDKGEFVSLARRRSSWC
ncbi:RNA cytidine acetyltransferase isoform X2 [Ischnura elegans]|uniref:RNA cytidine acetyltransferase isoform X2 n=1 Tax=Ischnura elegans TaxID=197161 RepID=UPI001ED8AD07|nr:RNA cytidine acetyltransferase isoform X2 [Ischnura elegans]